LDEADKVEGTTNRYVFQHIMLLLSSCVLLTGIILCWTRSLGEFGATLLFAGNLEGKTQTMLLAIYVGFEQGLGIALMLSVVLLAESFVLLVLLRRLIL
jgi:molybdate transport system permease protein